uniref:Uncharacterized protein n=1 Tax=Schistosoma mansoni TaxID=6183 RepID=A0A5K4FAX7_SCHMA
MTVGETQHHIECPCGLVTSLYTDNVSIRFLFNEVTPGSNDFGNKLSKPLIETCNKVKYSCNSEFTTTHSSWFNIFLFMIP